jgi:acetyl-CoA C-acetyltransferase
VGDSLRTNDAYILSACRTPIGSFLKGLSTIPATELGALVIRSAIERAHIDLPHVDEVIMGNVLSAGLGQGPARQASVQAGLPFDVPALSINKVCGSGLKAVILAAQSIMLGEARVLVAGGMENMSRCPYFLEGARQGYRMWDAATIDGMVRDGLWCSLIDEHMGITAENLAMKYGISRLEQDEFSLRSHEKAQYCMENNLFKEEIVPVEVLDKKNQKVLFAKDEHPRSGLTLDKFSDLRPAFKEGGTVTAGNSSGINDGAAAVVVASGEFIKQSGVRPLAGIVSWASSGVDPSVMGIGAATAGRKALHSAGLSIQDIDLFEINEAFASQALAVIRNLEIPESKVNVHGGSIALGHPIGASGARILVSLIHAMIQRDARYGLCALCIGGGMGIAMVVKVTL